MSMPEVSLAEILLGIESGSRPKGGVDEFGDIPSLGAEHLDGNGGFNFKKIKRVSGDFFEKMKAGRIRTHDILVVKDGATTGKVALVREDFHFEKAAVNEHVFILRPNPNVADPHYVFNFLNNENGKQLILKDFRGATVGGISKGFVDKIFIPLPPLAEQKRIAAILDKAAEIKVKREQAIAKLDELAQSTFVEMFGNPVTNSKNLEIQKLSEVGDLERGISKHRPRNAKELLGGKWPLIQTGDVANCDGYIVDYKQTYSEIGLKQSKLWPSGTLCITIAANIAKTGILTFEGCFPDSVVGFTAKNSCTVEYVRVWLSFLQKMIEDKAPESAQKNINLAILRDLNIPFPSLSKQREFESILKKIRSIALEHIKSSKKATEFIESLQYQAFTTGFSA